MAVQFVGNVARVSFADAAAKQLILRNEPLLLAMFRVVFVMRGHALKKFSCAICV